MTELPVLIINVQRGGPGLGSIQPSQADYWQATKALFVSGAYNIQVAGNTPNVVNGVAVAPQIASSNLNLVTTSQHVARLKVGYAF